MRYWFKVSEETGLIFEGITSDNKQVAKGYIEGTETIWKNQIKYKYNFETEQFEERTQAEIDAQLNQPKVYESIEIINNKVVEKIRERYDENEEIKMLRLGILDSANEDFIAYNAYVEECRTWGKNKKIELGFEA